MISYTIRECNPTNTTKQILDVLGTQQACDENYLTQDEMNAINAGK